MKELKLTGGATIGKASASYPFATLEVNKDQLELNASLIGNLVFQPSDIVSIEAYTKFSLSSKGIKIIHNVSSYKEEVVFTTTKDPQSVIAQIRETGFLNKELERSQSLTASIREQQASGAFPLKKSFAIAVVVIWNLLIIMDFIPLVSGDKNNFPLGNGALSALGLLFGSAFLSIISEDFRHLIMKEGRELKHIKRFSIFILFVSGVMLLFLGLMIRARG